MREEEKSCQSMKIREGGRNDEALSSSSSTASSTNTSPKRCDTLEDVLSDLRRYRDLYGENSLKVAEMWNTLGLIHLHYQHDVDHSIKCHERALQIYTTMEESNNDETPTTFPLTVTLFDLGNSYERMGDRQCALQLFRRAWRNIETHRVVPETHYISKSIRRALFRLERFQEP